MARRVTFVVAFGFLPQNFGRWRGPTNAILSFCDCKFSGGDTQTTLLLFHSLVAEMQKHLTGALAPARTRATW